jgi:hypothetical protein
MKRLTKTNLFLLMLVFTFLLPANDLIAQEKVDIKELTVKAQQGDIIAQYSLGYYYYNGYGVKQNYAEAVKWWTQAAEQGNVRAQYDLGGCYYKGHGVSKDYKKAVYWYAKAVQQDYKYAQYSLGLCFYNGDGVTQNYAEALKWFTKAAEQGHRLGEEGAEACRKIVSNEGKLLALYEKIQKTFDNPNYDSQTAISLINEYLLLAPENDENRGEQLNTLGLLYVNTQNTPQLLLTIYSLSAYDAALPQSEWKNQIGILEHNYRELSKKDIVFTDQVVGCWVSDRHNAEGTPYFIIYIRRDNNNNFVPQSLSMEDGSYYFASLNDYEKSWLRNSQSFYLNGDNRTLKAISGTEKLNVGNELGTMVMSTFVNELGNSLKNYIYTTDKNFMSSTLKGTAVSVGVQLLDAAIQKASVSKKEVKVCTLDLRMDANNILGGKLINTTYTMYSDGDKIDTKNDETNMRFTKGGWFDKIIFSTPAGNPIFIGGASTSDYQNSELYNINQRYKSNSKEKKAAIKEYNKQVYSRIGWVID